MGLFTDVVQNTKTVVEASAVVIRKTRRGAVIVCPECKGIGKTEEAYWDYGTKSDYPQVCPKCNGGGAVEVYVVKPKSLKVSKKRR